MTPKIRNDVDAKYLSFIASVVGRIGSEGWTERDFPHEKSL